MRIGIILLASLIFFGCTDKEKIAQLEEQKAQMETEYNLLVKESSMKDQFIEDYTRTVNEVYETLEKIREREGFLSKASRSLENNENASLKEKMLSDINSIDSYLQSSKKNLRALKEKMKNSQVKIESLEKTVENLSRTLDEKEAYIAELRTQTEQLTLEIAEVKVQLQDKEEQLQKQDRRLNTVFYIIGTEKELKEKGIIEEKGGFLGMGKTAKIATNLNYDYFTSTSISNIGRIPIYIDREKVDIISPHSPESYHLVERDKNETVLEITDPDEFWKLRYLVILYKG